MEPQEPVTRSMTPMTDAVNARFDDWISRVRKLKEEATEYAKEQIQKIQEEAEEWVKEKGEELQEDQDEAGDPPEEIGTVEKIEDALDSVNKTIEFVNRIITYVAAHIADIMGAVAACGTGMERLTEEITGGVGGGVGGGIPSVPGVGLAAPADKPVMPVKDVKKEETKE